MYVYVNFFSLFTYICGKLTSDVAGWELNGRALLRMERRRFSGPRKHGKKKAHYSTKLLRTPMTAPSFSRQLATLCYGEVPSVKPDAPPNLLPADALADENTKSASNWAGCD